MFDSVMDDRGDWVTTACLEAPPGLEVAPDVVEVPLSDWEPSGWSAVWLAEEALASDWADQRQRAQARADLVTAYAGLPPSPAAVRALAAVDPAALPAFVLADYLVLVDQCRSWVESLAYAGLAALGRSDRTEDRWSREQVMCAWRMSGRAARRELAMAKTLSRDLPATAAALAAGDLNGGQARALAAGCWRLDPEAEAGDARLEAAVLPRAGHQSAAATRAAVEAAVLAIDPSAARQRHERAFAERDVVVRAVPDGMASVTAWLRAVDAEQVMAGLDAAARALPKSDPRGRGQRRADLLLDAILAGARDAGLARGRDADDDGEDALSAARDAHFEDDAAIVGDARREARRGKARRAGRGRRRGPTAHGRRVQVHVHVSLATLLGADEAPGWVDGHGPVAAAEARRIAHELGGTWARVVDDPLGRPLAYARQVYQPPQALADHVLARDGECAFPSCRQPGWADDLDHITAWDDGGTTGPENLAPLCRRHHRGKTQRALSYTRHDDGSYAWSLADITGGNNRTHVSEPPRRLDPEPWGPELAAFPDECPF